MSIEQKIAEVLAESRDVDLDEDIDIIEEDEDLTEEEDLSDEDLSDEEDLTEEEDLSDEEDLTEEEDLSEEPVIDIKEDVAALVSGEDLSEEFKSKAATIFEAAVLSRVKQEVVKLDEAYEQRLAEEVENVKEGIVEKVDGYLDYVVEQWMERNEIALESGMRAEILENFMSGLKTLFEDHYVDIPEEQFDVLNDYQTQIDELNEKLGEQIGYNMLMKEELNNYNAKEIVESYSYDLTDSDKEKFFSLVEELDYEDAESFEKKVSTIRESYFQKTSTDSTLVESIVTDDPYIDEEEESVKRHDPLMEGYLSYFNKKLS